MNARPRPLHPLVAALLLALPLAWPGAAPAATLAGRVVARADGRAVEGARVRLLEASRAARTDSAGRFVFAHLAPGRYTLSSHHVAWADQDVPVTAADAPAAELVIRLEPALYTTDAIVVRSTRSPAGAGATPWATETAREEELRRTPAVTMADAVARLPGLALARDGAWETALSIRGLGRSNVVTLVDNTRIETATDVAGALSLVNPLDLERVEVVKSSGSVLSGSGSLGGVLQMVTRRAAFSDAPHTGLEWTETVNSVNRGATTFAALENGGPRHALRLSGGWRNASVTRTPRGLLANSQFRDYSGAASLGVRTVGSQTLTATVQRVQAEDTGIPGGAPFAATATATYRLARRQLAGLEYAMPNLRRGLPLLVARLSRQDIARNVELVQGPTVTVTPHATHNTTSGALEARLAPAAGHQLVVGGELWHRALDSRRERLLFAQHRTVGERPVPSAAYMSGGVYVQDDWTRGRVHAVLGARYDRSRTHADPAWNPEYVIANGVVDDHPAGQVLLWPGTVAYDHSWSANAGLNAELAPGLAGSLLFATAFRSPSLEERFQYLDLGSSLHVGNPALKPEQSVSLDAGAHARFGGLGLRADAFGNLLTDLVADVPGSFPGRTANVYVKSNIGRARLYGFELSGEQRLAPALVLLADAAYARGEDTRAHANLPQVAPLTGHAGLAWEAPRAGTLRVGCTAAHAQGNPAPGETATAGWTSWGADFAALPWNVGGGACRLRAGVENALDRAYRLHLSTLRGLVRLEPGRNAWASLTVNW